MLEIGRLFKKRSAISVLNLPLGRGDFSWVKRLKREAETEHLHLRMRGAITPLPQRI
jgi:hypothetical protein